jgi:glyceraldehyde 3-phosphate dehydrogenase
MPVLEETIGVKKALLNIVPTPRGPRAAIAVARAIPTLRGRFDGMAMRVPVLTGSISSIVFLAGRQTSAEEINEQLADASRQPPWSETLAVSRDGMDISPQEGEHQWPQ